MKLLKKLMTADSNLIISSDIRRVLNRLNSQETPIMIPVHPEADSLLESCFYNVDRVIQRQGGKVRYGWAILDGQCICEAERHAIWETKDGNLIDVTPRSPEMKQIMFVTDPKFVYKGDHADNIRVNKTSEILVDDFILIFETISKVYKTGKRKSETELTISREFNEMLGNLEHLKSVFQGFTMSGGKLMAPCFCGKGQPYKTCHRPGILNMLKSYGEMIDEYLAGYSNHRQ